MLAYFLEVMFLSSHWISALMVCARNRDKLNQDPQTKGLYSLDEHNNLEILHRNLKMVE